MGALRLLFAAELRRRWRSWLILVVLVALVAGLVLAAAAAGRRTAAAFPRFVASYGYDVYIYNQSPVTGLGGLPGVSSVTAIRVPGSGRPTCACTSQTINPTDFYINELSPQTLRRAVKLVAGRMPADSSPYDVLASFTLQHDFGVHVGSVIRAPLYESSQIPELGSGPDVRPSGPTVALHVVGIGAAEMEFPPGRRLNTTSSPLRRLLAPSTGRFPSLPSTSFDFVMARPASLGSRPPPARFTSSMSQIRPLPLRRSRHRSTPRPLVGGSWPSWPHWSAWPSSARRSVGRAWSKPRATPVWWPLDCPAASLSRSAWRGTFWWQWPVRPAQLPSLLSSLR